MVQTTRILTKHETVMILNDSFQQRTDFDSERSINVYPTNIFIQVLGYNVRYPNNFNGMNFISYKLNQYFQFE